MQIEGIKRSVLVILIACICCQASAAPDEQHFETNSSADPCAKNTAQIVGSVFGAVLGGFLGNKIGKGNGKKAATVVGALGGLALGNYIGSEMDRRKCELSKIAKKNDLTVVVSDINPAADNGGSTAPVGMSVSIEDKPDGTQASNEGGGEALGNAGLSTQFQSGSDKLSDKAESYFREIATQYALPFRPDALTPGATQEQTQAVVGLRQKRLLIVGHTDDTGSSRLNADLSEQRAKNVARLFAEAGVPEAQIYFQGSGETQPIADNRSEQGRAKNRRVEIVDLSNETAFQNYLGARMTNANFYRVTPPVASRPAPVAVPVVAQVATSKTSAKPAKAAGATPTLAKVGPAAGTAAASNDSGYDFGGHAQQGAVAPDIGKLVTVKSAFNFISPAIADDMPMARSCADDRPRHANPVKELRGGAEYHVSEYLPNLYSTSWSDTVNGNLLALTDVAVLRDGAAPAKNPTLLLYKAAHGKAGVSTKSDFRSTPEVNTYQGETALLYRVFVNGPIKCMDVIFPRDHPASASNSKLYYVKADQNMVVDVSLKIAK